MEWYHGKYRPPAQILEQLPQVSRAALPAMLCRDTHACDPQAA